MLLALAEHCDVLVENFRPGVTDRMGIGYDGGVGAQPAHRLRVDHRLRRRRPVEAPPRVRAGRRRRDRADAAAGRGARTLVGHSTSRTSPTIRTATPTSTPGSRPRRRSSPRCSSARAPAPATWIDVSMAQTMLYVNEHVHDHLWDGDDRPGLDPQLRPRRLPGADRGERRDGRHQRPSGRARHVRPLHRARSAAGPRRRPAVRRRADAPRPTSPS